MRERKRSIDIFSALCSILGTVVFLSFVWHDDPLPCISSEKVEMVWRSWPFQSVYYEGEFWHNGWESSTIITKERIWKKTLFGLKFSISNSSHVMIDTKRYFVVIRSDQNFPGIFELFEKKRPPFPDGYPVEFRKMKKVIKKARAKVKKYFSNTEITFSPQLKW